MDDCKLFRITTDKGVQYLLKIYHDDCADSPLDWEDHFMKSGKRVGRPLFVVTSQHRNMGLGDKDGASWAWDILKEQPEFDEDDFSLYHLYHNDHKVPAKYIKYGGHTNVLLTTGKEIQAADEGTTTTGWHWRENEDVREQDDETLAEYLDREYAGLAIHAIGMNEGSFWFDGYLIAGEEGMTKDFLKGYAKTLCQYFQGDTWSAKYYTLAEHDYDLISKAELLDLTRPKFGQEADDCCGGFYGLIDDEAACLDHMMDCFGLLGKVEEIR